MGDELKIVRDWLLKLPDLDLEDIVADGGVTSGMVVQQEAALMASKLSAILARAQGPGPGEAVAWRRIDEHDGSPEPVFGICLTAYAPAPFETWFLDGAWRLYSQAEEKRSAGVMKWFPTHFVRKSDLFAIRGPGPGVAAAWPETMSPDVKGALELAFLKAKPLASHLAAPKLYQALRAAMIAATPPREG